jgi:hypothetical protein
MQLRSPEQILGRCLSIYSATTFGGMSLGAWVWGALADWHSVAFAMRTAALWMIISLIVLRRIAPMPHEGRIEFQ